VIDDTRTEYERVRPEVPDIGGMRNVFQPVMMVNGWIVALHRGMSRRGKLPEDAIRVFQEVFDGWLQKLPVFVLKATGRLLLSAPLRWYFASQARRSRERRYAEDFVWRVEQGPAGEISLVFDECAVHGDGSRRDGDDRSRLRSVRPALQARPGDGRPAEPAGNRTNG
jgi:hypothetical protein